MADTNPIVFPELTLASYFPIVIISFPNPLKFAMPWPHFLILVSNPALTKNLHTVNSSHRVLLPASNWAGHVRRDPLCFSRSWDFSTVWPVFRAITHWPGRSPPVCWGRLNHTRCPWLVFGDPNHGTSFCDFTYNFSLFISNQVKSLCSHKGCSTALARRTVMLPGLHSLQLHQIRIHWS